MEDCSQRQRITRLIVDAMQAGRRKRSLVLQTLTRRPVI